VQFSIVGFMTSEPPPIPGVAPETANADDYTLEKVDATHFIIEEQPDLVRARLVALAEETRR
jgi:hypothetical protein